jgi:transposase
MEQYVGLDVSQKDSTVCVIDGDGKRVWQGSCRSTPDAMAEVVRKKAPQAIKVAMETGPLAVWHWHELKAAGVPIVCIHARHAKAALSMQINKTDANDAFGLAQIVRTGWYRPGDMKSMESHKLRLLVAARTKLVSMRTALYSQIRGLLKTFGVVLAPGKGGSFEQLVVRGVPNDRYVKLVIESLLSTWRHLTTEIKKFNREIERAARAIPACRRLMTVPGVGSLTSVSYATTVDEPRRFRRSKDLGPYLGLTPRKYQSGEVDRAGSVSKCGDRMTRSLLFEAAGVLLFRNRQSSAIRDWGLKLSRRAGTRKARVAVARKLAVLLHRLWTNECVFEAYSTV